MNTPINARTRRGPIPVADKLLALVNAKRAAVAKLEMRHAAARDELVELERQLVTGRHELGRLEVAAGIAPGAAPTPAGLLGKQPVAEMERAADELEAVVAELEHQAAQ
jgi:hypothetical protein